MPDYLRILRDELILALGCTEPIALAYGAAQCRKLLGEEPVSITAACCANIIKNVKSVVVPNTGGMRGIPAAIAAGMVSHTPDAKLELLNSLHQEDVKTIKEIVDSGMIKTELLESRSTLDFVITMQGREHIAATEIRDCHTNIVSMMLDGKSIISQETEQSAAGEVMNDGLSIDSIVDFAESAALDELDDVFRPQIENNIRICREGLSSSWGAGIGRILDSSGMHIQGLAAAGSDARMNGCSLPVVINSGSGNQGIAASVPVIAYAEEKSCSREQLLRALAISNLIAIYQKTKIGRLSAYCGAVCAAAGSGAAMTYLDGGSRDQIKMTVMNTIATVSGMICDGAKSSCAGKIAVALDAAMIAHQMAMIGDCYADGDGIIKADADETVAAVGYIAREGMRDTDKKILSVMLS